MRLVELAFILTVVLVAGGVVGLTLVAARRAGRSPWRVAGPVAAALVAWLAVTGGLAAAGVLRVEHGPQRVLPLALFAMVAANLVLARPTGRALIAAAPPGAVMALQVFRVPVELVLWRLFVLGVVPVQMTFAGQNLDVLTGATAIPVACAAWGAARRRWRVAAAWHVAGLVLLVNIVSVAVRSVPGPLRTFAAEPANTIIGHAPFVWLPTFLVPVALVGHVVGLRQAWAARPSSCALSSQSGRSPR